MNTIAPTLDFAAIKARQQETWSTGDFAVVAARIAFVAERLAEAADLRADWRVLDVATGSGNAAIAAARSGCEVVGVDYVPELLERGRQRAAAEGLDVTFLHGDAEELPFPDHSFDAVLSVYGSMFAPDQERAAAELLRVCRPGGKVAMANWTPDGFIGQLFRTVGRHVPPPAGLRSPIEWGTEARLRELLGASVSRLDVQEQVYTFRFRSAEEFVDTFRTWYGPTAKAFAALEPAGQEALADDLAALARSYDRVGEDADAVSITATYVEAIATKR
jgi:ubiquinone/menaquinone biosynthesis C-methylase UbiE